MHLYSVAPSLISYVVLHMYKLEIVTLFTFMYVLQEFTLHKCLHSTSILLLSLIVQLCTYLPMYVILTYIHITSVRHVLFLFPYICTYVSMVYYV